MRPAARSTMSSHPPPDTWTNVHAALERPSASVAACAVLTEVGPRARAPAPLFHLHFRAGPVTYRPEDSRISEETKVVATK